MTLLQGRKPTKKQWDEAQLDFVSESRYPSDSLQGRTPAERAENLRACELLLIGGGLCGMFAAGFFAGQFLVWTVGSWVEWW